MAVIVSTRLFREPTDKKFGAYAILDLISPTSSSGTTSPSQERVSRSQTSLRHLGVRSSSVGAYRSRATPSTTAEIVLVNFDGILFLSDMAPNPKKNLLASLIVHPPWSLGKVFLEQPPLVRHESRGRRNMARKTRPVFSDHAVQGLPESEASHSHIHTIRTCPHATLAQSLSLALSRFIDRSILCRATAKHASAEASIEPVHPYLWSFGDNSLQCL